MTASVQSDEISAAKLVEDGRIGVVRMCVAKRGLGGLERPRLGIGDAHLAPGGSLGTARSSPRPPWHASGLSAARGAGDYGSARGRASSQ